MENEELGVNEPYEIKVGQYFYGAANVLEVTEEGGLYLRLKEDAGGPSWMDRIVEMGIFPAHFGMSPCALLFRVKGRGGQPGGTLDYTVDVHLYKDGRGDRLAHNLQEAVDTEGCGIAIQYVMCNSAGIVLRTGLVSADRAITRELLAQVKAQLASTQSSKWVSDYMRVMQPAKAWPRCITTRLRHVEVV